MTTLLLTKVTKVSHMKGGKIDTKRREKEIRERKRER